MISAKEFEKYEKYLDWNESKSKWELKANAPKEAELFYKKLYWEEFESKDENGNIIVEVF